MGYATTMMKKTGRAMRLDTQIIEVRPLLLRKEQVRLRLRETCARNHKNKKPKSLDTADVVRDVVNRRLHQLRPWSVPPGMTSCVVVSVIVICRQLAKVVIQPASRRNLLL